MSDDPETLSDQNPEHDASDPERPVVRFFALIIGINNYADPKWLKLDGAVADAKAMKQYLVDMLGVSENHIITLYNRRATRGAIIAAFRRLRDDERINHGDPIVIFYSGHGGQVPPPSTWESKENIQAIIPQDSVTVPPGTVVPKDYAPIPDLTIGALIGDIAKAKGDNITVIFDCCYAGSATRGHKYVPRGVHIDFNIPDALDEDILRGRAGEISGNCGVTSHVLLAACSKRELAYECRNSRRGQFTVALLERLQNCPISERSYIELFEGIRLENIKLNQHPQCIGANRHRILFDAKVLAGSHIFRPVRACKSGCVINAGFAHGVRHGVEFTLFDDKKGRLGSVPVDRTSSIRDFDTVVTSVSFAGVSFARLTRVGKIPLYVDKDSAALDFLQRSDGYGTDAQQFQLVQVEEEANLEVTMENDRFVFRTLDEKVKGLGLTKLPHTARPDNVARVLASAARYYWFLGFAEKRGLISSEHGITLDFCLLDVDYDEFGLPLFFPGRSIFSRPDPNSGNSDMIDFVVDPDAVYGLKITNNTSRDLFLNVFLFNNSDLSIVSYYTQASAGESDAPLKKEGGTFTIGYGTEGTPPFFFKLEKCQDVDVSHLKIFFATQRIDMSDIAQRSPFSKEGVREGTDEDEDGRGLSSILNVVRAAGKFKRGSSYADKPWFAFDIPVVQRREAIVEAV